MECNEVGCGNPVKPGHRKCNDCLEYARGIRAHERSEPEPLDLTEIKPNLWTDGVYTYRDEGDDSDGSE